MTTRTAPEGFGTGPLSRAAARFYTVAVVDVLLLLAVVPGLAVLVLLDRGASNLPVLALCALPLGPALSAAFHALHHHRADLADLRPARRFLRGYRLNLGASLRIWLPYLAWMTIIAMNLGHFSAAGVPGWWAVLLVVIAVMATLVCANALAIASVFHFRTRDILRLSSYFLVRRPTVTFGNLGLIVAALCVNTLASEAVVTVVGGVFAVAWLTVSRPMLNDVRKDFVG